MAKRAKERAQSQKAARERSMPKVPANKRPGAQHPLLNLQRLVGNQAVGRILGALETPSVDAGQSRVEGIGDRLGVPFGGGASSGAVQGAQGAYLQRILRAQEAIQRRLNRRQLELMRAVAREVGIRVYDEGEDLVGLEITLVDRDYDRLPADINRLFGAAFRRGQDYVRNALTRRGLLLAGQTAQQRGQQTMRLLLAMRYEDGVFSHIEVARPPVEEEAETREAEAPEQAPTEEGEEEAAPRQRQFWDLRDGALVILPPYDTIAAFRFAGQASSRPQAIEIQQVARVSAGWGTFLMEAGANEVKFARIEEVTGRGVRVSWWHYILHEDGERAVIAPDEHPPQGGRTFLDRTNIGGMLSIASLRAGTRLIQRVAPAVALGSVAALAFFTVGPAAGVAGMGSAATTATESAIISATSGGVVNFISETTQAMLGAEDPAHFYRRAAWGEILRHSLVAALSNAGGAYFGGRIANFLQLNESFMGFCSSMLFNVLSSLLNMSIDESDEERVVRELRQRMSRTADPAERAAIQRRLEQARRRAQQQAERELSTGFWRDLFKEAITA